MPDAPKPPGERPPTPSKNPFVERGVVLSPKDYEILRMGVMAVASEAERQAERATTTEEKQASIGVKAHAIDVLERLQQYQFAGDPDGFEYIMKKFEERIERVLKENRTEDALARALGESIAAMLRVHPDPARAVAAKVLDLSGKLASASEMQNVGPAILRPLLGRLRGERDMYKEKSWWPATVDYLDYVVALLEDWSVKVSQGKKPWEELPE